MFRHKMTVVIVALTLIVAACGGETSADTTGSPDNARDGSGTAGADDGGTALSGNDTRDLAGYLAELYDVNADLVDAQSDAAAATDPRRQAELISGFVADVQALEPPAGCGRPSSADHRVPR